MRSRKVDGPGIRKVRETKGLSVQRLVALLSADEKFAKSGKSVTDSMVRKIETGIRQPGPELFAAMRRALKARGANALLLPADQSERAA